MSVDKYIKKRKTQKILAEGPLPVIANMDHIKNMVEELLDLATYAPYHYKCHSQYLSREEMNSVLPFRMYCLDQKDCRAVADYIKRKEIRSGKIVNMLYAADALILTTWLPDKEKGVDTLNITEESIPFEGSYRNMEHIAAASSAIQNILIGATERGIPNYWSSGGQLRNEVLRSYLKVPLDEILLGAIFLFTKEYASHGILPIPGKNRDLNKDKEQWRRWVDIK